jgi:N-acetyl-anhydromuramyl-L-alanine amidase AmpD
MPDLPQHIFGLHDLGGESLSLNAGKPSWVVVTVKASDGGADFSALSNSGIGVIVRLNHGYGSDGTVPPSSQYDAFAEACASYAGGSKGVRIWIIGNETNLAAERPGNSGGNDGEMITPDRYAQCFAKCRAAIRNQPGHDEDWVIPAAPAPWNNQTTYPGNPAGDWVQYFQDILNQCLQLAAPPDALALHTYTHGFDASLIASEQMLGAPFPNRHFHFRAYRDFLGAVPAALRMRPVFITETQAADPTWWQDRNIAWIQSAYAEINAWNSVPANQPIQALCLFRWQTGDVRWSISDKSALQNDFRAALQNDYRVRWAAPQPPPQPPTESGWCPFAVKRPITANNYDVGRSGHPVTAVVLHVAAGPLSAVFPTFNNPSGLVSAHFCVGKDGTIEQYVSVDDSAYAVGMRYTNGQWLNPRGVPSNPTWQDLQPPFNPNLYTISIEHEGQPEDQWTAQMDAANNRLLQWIAAQVGASRGTPFTYVPHRTLIGHWEIDPVDRPNCPGPNVDYERIAADANAAPESPGQVASIQTASLKIGWLAIDSGAALYRFAQSNNLGCPQTNEFEFPLGGETYVGEVFNLGLAYVKKGDWGNVRWVQKPDGPALARDPVATAAVAAAQQKSWMPVNTDSGFYKFAQANQLGCPQTDEFEFNAGEDYLGQVYVGGVVYARKSNLNVINWVPKPKG